MEQNDGEPLGGIIEADETFVGGKLRQSDRARLRAAGRQFPGAYAKDRAVVVGAVERKRHGKIPPASSPLGATQRRPCASSCCLQIDDRVHRRLARPQRAQRLRQAIIGTAASTIPSVSTWMARLTLQTIEGFWGHFKTDLRGTHHAVSAHWLPSYLNEWLWKWNHRDDDAAMFRTLLDNAAQPNHLPHD